METVMKLAQIRGQSTQAFNGIPTEECWIGLSELCKVGSGVLAVPDQLCNASFP